MHKDFYASGFLYHPKTEQILLHQPDTNDSHLTLFSGKNTSSEKAVDVFLETIVREIDFALSPQAITFVYDYFNKTLQNHTYVFYGEVDELTLDFTLSGSGAVGWFPLKLLPKLQMAKQSRHDITIGQRVIQHLQRQETAEASVASNRQM